MSLPGERPRSYSVLVDLVAGVAHARSGNLELARARVESQRRQHNPDVFIEQAWHAALRGEVALAENRWAEAASVFASAESGSRFWLGFQADHATVFAQNMPLRDGHARAAKARGDLSGAIERYRQLLAPPTDQKWSAILEPRHVLELARLLEQKGDNKAALTEYQRFLDLWKRADANLPELGEARRAVARLAN
jgi:tetratricopeptide (TPR) repeat protein